jgi:diguanylate cyclase (GGDEF)-like protein
MLSLALLDIDHFKRVNDSQGHLAGDQVLATLGRLLLDRFRREDLRARWGGEEFVLAFPGEPAAQVKGVLERVLAEFRTLEFEGSAGRFSCSFTSGVASFPADGKSTDALLKVADQRLYAGKKAGRSRVVSGDASEAKAEEQ